MQWQKLGLHYRRIPILAVGRDLYCDSRNIIAKLEQLYTSRPKLGADIHTAPHACGIERILETWALENLFMKTAQLIPPDASLMQHADWLADRAELTGGQFSVEALRANVPVALSNARLHLQILENNLFADGRLWLAGGDSPSLSDVHVLWIFDWMLRPKELMGMQHAYSDLLNEQNYPRVFAWVKRMDYAITDTQKESGKPKILSDDDAVQLIEKAPLWDAEDLSVDSSDPTDLQTGDMIDLIALDSAPQTGLRRRDVGSLAGLTINTVTIATQSADGTDVRIHYPRNNVRVAKAGNGPRLRASEIP